MKTNNNQLTVKSLRQSGTKVKVEHSRRLIPANIVGEIFDYIPKGSFNKKITKEVEYVVSAKGGQTKVIVDFTDGRHYEANTICSKKDHYSKSRGLKICLARISRDIKNSEV